MHPWCCASVLQVARRVTFSTSRACLLWIQRCWPFLPVVSTFQLRSHTRAVPHLGAEVITLGVHIQVRRLVHEIVVCGRPLRVGRQRRRALRRVSVRWERLGRHAQGIGREMSPE
jgi:hypothetical protein